MALPPVRAAFRDAVDAVAADRPDLVHLAVRAMTQQLDALRRSRFAAEPLARFLAAAAQHPDAFAPTPAAQRFWLAASRDPRAQAPLSSAPARAFAHELLGALDAVAEVAAISLGAPLLHHPFDAHDDACVLDGLGAAAALRELAARIAESRDALLQLQFAEEQQRTARAFAGQAYGTSIGPETMLGAVVASTLCPQNRLAVYHTARALGRALDGTVPRRLVAAARELEDAALTHVVAPLRHGERAPHVWPACFADAQNRAAQLRLAHETPLDARAPAADDAPRTAVMALLRAAHASGCPAVRAYLMDYVATADPNAARTPLEWRRVGGAWAVGPVRSMPAPRVSLPRLADELDRQAQTWVPLALRSPPRGQ